MAYEVQRSAKGFRLLEVSYTPKRTVKTVPREAYPAVGFRHDMTFEEAKARAKQLTKVKELHRRAAAEAARRVRHKADVNEAYFPASWLEEFDGRLEEETAGSDVRLRTVKMQWQTAQRILSKLELDPKDYKDRKRLFYREFEARKLSVDYSNQLLRLVNLWGRFVSRKTNSFFDPVPKLKGIHRESVVKARRGKRGVRTKAVGLRDTVLNAAKDTFTHNGLAAQWNWLFVSLWFGLRPEETDGLALGPERMRIAFDKERKLYVLWIYQTKLTSIAEADRWKPIPAFEKEQKAALKIIEADAPLKRPLTKTLHRYLGDGFGNYSPRNGFTDLMLERGHLFEDVANYLGHRDLKTTWQHYKDKARFQLPKRGSK